MPLRIASRQARLVVFGYNAVTSRIEWLRSPDGPQYAGDPLSLTGAQVMAFYKDGTASDITAVCGYDPAEGTLLEYGGELNIKQDALTFDESPASGSRNPVRSGGIHTALQGKQDDLTRVPTVNSLLESDYLFLERNGRIYKIRASAVIIPSGDDGDNIETEDGSELLTESGDELLADI